MWKCKWKSNCQIDKLIKLIKIYFAGIFYINCICYILSLFAAIVVCFMQKPMSPHLQIYKPQLKRFLILGMFFFPLEFNEIVITNILITAGYSINENSLVLKGIYI